MERHISAEIEDELLNSFKDTHSCNPDGSAGPSGGSPPDPALDSDATMEVEDSDQDASDLEETPQPRGRKGKSMQGEKRRSPNPVQEERALEASYCRSNLLAGVRLQTCLGGSRKCGGDPGAGPQSAGQGGDDDLKAEGEARR